MRYMGGKCKLGARLWDVMRADMRDGKRMWVEPFVGGGGMLCHVPHEYARYASDVNPYVVAMLQSLAGGWSPPAGVDKAHYLAVQRNPDAWGKDYAGYVLTQYSFFGRYSSGYQRSGYQSDRSVYQSAMRAGRLMQGAHFDVANYRDIDPPFPAVIYCDPPYAGTAGYSADKSFSHDEFWSWCRTMVAHGHVVYVSERTAPDDFQRVWSSTLKVEMKDGSNHRNERLFRLADAPMEIQEQCTLFG